MFFAGKRQRIGAATLALSLFFASGAAVAEHPSFKKAIYPILKTHCIECHRPGGVGYAKSGLDLSTYEGLMKGTKFGPVVVPGDAFMSNLMVLVEGRADESLRMPHGSHRPAPSKAERKELIAWINAGARKDDAYRRKVRPVLKAYCVECHRPGGIGYKRAGLDLTTYEGLMKGTKFGPVVVPGDAFMSNLVAVIEGRAGAAIKMPYIERAALTRWEKRLLRMWINNGAKNN